MYRIHIDSNSAKKKKNNREEEKKKIEIRVSFSFVLPLDEYPLFLQLQTQY